MSNAAVIEIDDSVTPQLAALKTDSSIRAIQLTIEKEVLKVVQSIPATEDMQADFDGLQGYLSPKEPAYFVAHLGRSPDHAEYVLIVHIPVGCPIRPRTIFASSRSFVEKYLGHIFNGIGNYFVDDARELTFSTFLGATVRDESSMTYDEIQMRDEQLSATVSQVSLPTHDTFTWPVTDDLKELLRAFAQGSGPRVVAGQASNTGGAISTSGTGESLADIDSAAPRYIAIRCDNKGTEVKVFVLYCPDSAKSREKMMSSTCKASFLKGCAEVGLTFDKTFEIRDPSDFSDANLDALINPVAVNHGYGQIRINRKPRAPGRK